MPLLALLLAFFANARGQEVISQESGNESAGGGVIIEIGGDGNNGGTGENSGAAVAPEEPVNITRNPGDTGIEMIVGGQSQDGVAKRSNLPVVE